MDKTKKELIKRIDATIMYIKETQDFYTPLVAQLEDLKDLINKNL